jgi:hypothetical protein
MSSLRSPALVFVVAAAASIAACSKKDDSGAPSAVPPLPQGAPTPSAAPPAPPSPPTPPPAPLPAPQGAGAALGGAAPAGEGGSITGKIELAAAIAKKKPQGTLFLVARRISDNPNARGTLIAVKKLPATTFPLPFTLSAADMPFQNGPFDGELTLTARIDQDGDPLSHQKGDVLGSLPKVQVGSKNVRLTLDQVQKEDESLAGPMGGGGPMMPPGHPGAGAMPPGHPAMPAGHP